jgi:ketosteroid isomerase-like protein
VDTDPEAVVIAAYDAVSCRDLEALERLIDPEIEVIDPDLPGGGSFHGPDGVRQFVQQWLDAFEELDVQIERLIKAGHHVVACLHQRGRSVAGVPVELRDGHVWTVVGGRATRVELYLTHDAALEAAQPH